jgi:hypothetical protein
MGLGFSIRDDSTENLQPDVLTADNYVSFSSGQNQSKNNIKDIEAV